MAHDSNLDVAVGDTGEVATGVPFLPLGKVLQQPQSKEGAIEAGEALHQVDLSQRVGYEKGADKEEEHSEPSVGCDATETAVDEGLHSSKA